MMRLHRLRVLVAVGLAGMALASAPASHAAASGPTYVVRPNDTLWDIALAQGTTVAALMAYNNLTDADRLAVGQVLGIPTPSSDTSSSTAGTAMVYIVRDGDTLSSIALRLGISQDSLGAANNLQDWCTIYAGQHLIIPSSTAAPAPAVTAPAAAPTTLAAPATTSSVAASSADIAALLTQQALSAGVDVSLVKAVAWQESGWQMVTAQDGGMGVMQLMPDAVDWVSTALLRYRINPNDPADNIRGGVAMLRYFLRLFNGDVRQAVAAYHQGLGSVQAHGISAECARYIANVLALQLRFS